MSTVEDFGDSPETFDLDSWIDQGTRPRRTVTIYRDWSLLDEYERAVKAVEDAATDDEAMGDAGPQEVLEDVLARMEASRQEFVVQALTNEEMKALAQAAPTKTVDLPDGKTRERVDEVLLADAVVSAAVVSPAITPEQVKRMRENLGDGPTYALYQAAAELQTAGKELPSVPTSRES